MILAYFLVANAFYAALIASAALDLWVHVRRVRGESRWMVLSSPFAPRVTVLSPAHNEAATIVASVDACLRLRYANVEIIVINDGSSDETLQVLHDRFDLDRIHPVVDRRLKSAPVRGLYRSRLHPTILVVDKESGGRADALNAGIDLATGELVCVIDADTLIEPEALRRMVRPFLLSDAVLAAGGTIRVANGCVVADGLVVDVRLPRNLLGAMQALEYLRAFLIGRLGWNRLGGNLIIAGAFGLFRRESIVSAGGYTSDSVGEDMELVVRLRRHGYEQGGPTRVDFIPDPVAWTQAPESLRVLGGQRERWHRGLADTLWRHRRLLFNPRYGALGLVGFPYFLFVELLGPVVEAAGIVGVLAGLAVGVVDVQFALLLFFVAYGIGIILTFTCVLLEGVSYRGYRRIREPIALLGLALLETFGYRQLTVIWRISGLVGYLRRRSDWGNMERRGFTARSTQAAKP